MKQILTRKNHLFKLQYSSMLVSIEDKDKKKINKKQIKHHSQARLIY